MSQFVSTGCFLKGTSHSYRSAKVDSGKIGQLLCVVNYKVISFIIHSPQSTQVPSQQHQQSQLLIEEEVDMNALREREQAIRKIEGDIVEVNQIFKDLATMVHDQGEVLDSIEANIESTTIQIHEGTDQLVKASDYSVCKNSIFWRLNHPITIKCAHLFAATSSKEEIYDNFYLVGGSCRDHRNNLHKQSLAAVYHCAVIPLLYLL